MPVRMSKQNKTKQKASFGEDTEKLKHLNTIHGNVNGTAIMENKMESPQIIKNRTTI